MRLEALVAVVALLAGCSGHPHYVTDTQSIVRVFGSEIAILFYPLVLVSMLCTWLLWRSQRRANDHLVTALADQREAYNADLREQRAEHRGQLQAQSEAHTTVFEHAIQHGVDQVRKVHEEYAALNTALAERVLADSVSTRERLDDLERAVATLRSRR